MQVWHSHRVVMSHYVDIVHSKKSATEFQFESGARRCHGMLQYISAWCKYVQHWMVLQWRSVQIIQVTACYWKAWWQAHPVDSEYIFLCWCSCISNHSTLYNITWNWRWEWIMEWITSEGYRGAQEIERQISHKFSHN